MTFWQARPPYTVETVLIVVLVLAVMLLGVLS